MQISPNVKSFFAIWLIGAFATIAILAALTSVALHNGGWWGYLRLVRGGTSTQGIIVRTNPGNHCLAEYSFVVGNKSYSGGGPDCSARSNKNVTVTYLIADPTLSCLGSAEEKLWNELITFILGGLIFPPCIIFGVQKMRKARS